VLVGGAGAGLALQLAVSELNASLMPLLKYLNGSVQTYGNVLLLSSPRPAGTTLPTTRTSRLRVPRRR